MKSMDITLVLDVRAWENIQNPQRKVIIDSLLDFVSYPFYYINIEVTYELLTLE